MLWKGDACLARIDVHVVVCEIAISDRKCGNKYTFFSCIMSSLRFEWLSWPRWLERSVRERMVVGSSPRHAKLFDFLLFWSRISSGTRQDFELGSTTFARISS